MGKRRQGSIILWSLVAVVGLMLVIGMFQWQLSERVRQSSQGAGLMLGRVQALYLAEMGLNELMFQANVHPEGPFPLAGAATRDFTAQVALARAEPGGSATCTLRATGGDPPYEAVGTLRLAAGTFTRTVGFDVGRAAAPIPGRSTAQWVLTRYVLKD